MSAKLKLSSLKDAAYKGAQSTETLSACAQYILGQCPDFLETKPEEVVNQLKEGWALRYSELHPGQRYTQDWVPIGSDAPSTDGELIASLAFALSYTQQQFGKLKSEDPARHSVVGEIRKAFQKYCANRLEDLSREMKRSLGLTRQRHAQADDWIDAMNKAFDSFEKRCATSKTRGDSTAPEVVKYRIARQAFFDALNK